MNLEQYKEKYKDKVDYIRLKQDPNPGQNECRKLKSELDEIEKDIRLLKDIVFEKPGEKQEIYSFLNVESLNRLGIIGIMMTRGTWDIPEDNSWTGWVVVFLWALLILGVILL
jgi:hypothetical protein